ncbi:TENS4 protein, partial [Pomatorhinus ruficollis]|nr:TENS4 protein [Pomatorhinus ruficollis]
MSQVIESHVLRVGQTVCISSPEESKSLHPAGYPGCSTLPGKYVYYSTEAWTDPPSMVHPKARLVPTGRAFGAQPVAEHVAAHMQGKSQQNSSLERPPAPCQPKEEDNTSMDPEAQPVSPSLDITIETLNKMILEIDPTFQPLPCRPVKDAAQAPAQGDAAATKKQDPEAIGEVKAALGLRSQWSSDLVKTFCPEPGEEGLGTRLSPGPTQGPGLLGETGNGHQGHSPLSPSTGDSFLTPGFCIKEQDRLHIQALPNSGASRALALRAQQRGSWVSQLSTSPGSDTSYILGSSTHSLQNEDSDASAAASLSPSSSLGSPCSPSSGIVSHSRAAFGHSPTQHRAGSSPSASTSLGQKGQASSCPPSILTSAADIPVLLVNGCLEQGDGPPRLAKAPPSSATQPPVPGCSAASRLGGLNNALSAPALSCFSDSPLKAGQPTMKFVMDTSKYWFKPSISRDRAIQLLRDKEPGTFLVRDSTSFRGSFGLAMKVPGSQTGEDSSDLVRHFLIESSTKGVHLKGASEELYFGSLSAFVYQHSITQLALPCKLSIPTRDLADGEDSPDCTPESALSLARKTAVCNVLYLNSVNVETLTGAPAILKGISCTLELETLPTPTLVHFRVTEQGVTLTDVQRKVFFRRHYPLAAIRFCGMDPENRKWQKYCKSSRIFGFVAKSQADSGNVCHLFAEYDTVQPVSLVIDLLRQLLPSP